MNKKNYVWGVLLIVIGALGICANLFDLDIFTMDKLWPLFVVVPGLSFEFGYFSNGRNAGLLVPGGILTTIGLLFFFETYTNWMFASYTWPIYILSVAIGLFQLYWFGGRERGVLIAAEILGLISAIFFISMVLEGVTDLLSGNLVFPIILIALGIVVLINSYAKSK